MNSVLAVENGRVHFHSETANWTVELPLNVVINEANVLERDVENGEKEVHPNKKTL